MVIDTVSADLTIGNREFYVVNAKVVHSNYKSSNYAEIKCYPGPDVDIPEDITLLRGNTASISAETTLSDKREQLREKDGGGDTSIEKDSLLFEGNVARIYRAGDGSIDVVLFDPGQSLFESFSAQSSPSSDEAAFSTEEKQSSIQNGKILLGKSQTSNEDEEETAIKIKASEAVKKVLVEIGIKDKNVDLKDGGKEFVVNGETFVGAYDRELTFDKTEWNAHNLLKEIENRTESTFLFEKDGTFKFGTPDIKRHKLYYVTDTTAGIKSPPYQSVKVVGTGIDSDSKEGSLSMIIDSEDKIVKKFALGDAPIGGGGTVGGEVADSQQFNSVDTTFSEAGDSSSGIISGTTKEPVYTYKSSDLVTDAQVESTALSVIRKIKEQQKGGEITVVGYPEVTLNDSLILTEEFGGEAYAATKITHRIDSAEGFTTKINVTAPLIDDGLGQSANLSGAGSTVPSSSISRLRPGDEPLQDNDSLGLVEFPESAISDDEYPVGKRGPNDVPIGETVSDYISTVAEAQQIIRSAVTGESIEDEPE